MPEPLTLFARTDCACNAPKPSCAAQKTRPRWRGKCCLLSPAACPGQFPAPTLRFGAWTHNRDPCSHQEHQLGEAASSRDSRSAFTHTTGTGDVDGCSHDSTSVDEPAFGRNCHERSFRSAA